MDITELMKRPNPVVTDTPHGKRGKKTVKYFQWVYYISVLHSRPSPFFGDFLQIILCKNIQGTSLEGLTMTIPPALTMLCGRVTVTVPWPLLVVVVLAPPACTIWVPASDPAGMVIIPAKKKRLELNTFQITLGEKYNSIKCINKY